MCHGQHLVPLGFCQEKVPAGAHICQIYCEEKERSESLLNYLLVGLQSGERTACFSEKTDANAVRGFLAENNLSYDELELSKAITMAGTRDVYFKGNRFDPDRMLETLSTYHEESRKMGFPFARVIGEMAPEIGEIEGGGRLLEYESRVSLLLKDHPVTAVCQYDANSFDGAVIMDILKVHPQIIMHGKVIHNPFHIPPEIFLGLS